MLLKRSKVSSLWMTVVVALSILVSAVTSANFADLVITDDVAAEHSQVLKVSAEKNRREIFNLLHTGAEKCIDVALLVSEAIPSTYYFKSSSFTLTRIISDRVSRPPPAGIFA